VEVLTVCGGCVEVCAYLVSHKTCFLFCSELKKKKNFVRWIVFVFGAFLMEGMVVVCCLLCGARRPHGADVCAAHVKPGACLHDAPATDAAHTCGPCFQVTRAARLCASITPPLICTSADYGRLFRGDHPAPSHLASSHQTPNRQPTN
jgi:hypothetical protein